MLGMKLTDDACYRVLLSRDPRFDGVFFVGVTTTGIYCRPVCTARTPGRDRCRFFASAPQAEQAGFRPCLRCRPELAPGNSTVDALSRTARLAAARIETGALADGGSVERLARSLGVSSRQLRRAVQQELGVTPIQLAQTRRLLLAKQLLTESRLPIIQVAAASGFASVRRFNALFRTHYGLTPSRMRRGSARAPGDRLRLLLAYRPPLAWRSMLRFLAARATSGVELVADNAYLRTLAIGKHRGWLRVEPVAGKNLLAVELSTSLVGALGGVLARIKDLFDLSARPDVIARALSADRNLAAAVKRTPGLRVPGTVDAVELAVRAILGQQISVAAATTLAGRLAAEFGETIETPYAGLNRLTPTAERLATTSTAAVASLGLRSGVAAAIHALAVAIAEGRIVLEPGADAEQVAEQLVELPGVGAWTAQYIAMRALRWPDALPASDLGLLRAAGVRSPVILTERAEAWRPWRAYAAMHLWESLHELPAKARSSTTKPRPTKRRQLAGSLT